MRRAAEYVPWRKPVARRCSEEELLDVLERYLYEILHTCECEGVCGGEYTCAEHYSRRGAAEIVDMLKEMGYLSTQVDDGGRREPQ